MKSFLRQTISPLLRIWRNLAYDDNKFRLATRQGRASGWTWKTFAMEYRRDDYAVILKACRITKQTSYSFLHEGYRPGTYLTE
jgi:hypothetical protein